MMHTALTILIACLTLFGCADASHAPATSNAQPVIHVAAAADLTRAFTELGQIFETKTRQKIDFSFGSTGLLAKQIREGAPFDIFAAANVSFVSDLVKAQACDGATQAAYARGRLVIWSKNGVVQPARSLNELADPRFRRIAIAQPEHAPYGKAAQEALYKLKLWNLLAPRIVYGENVKQAQQFAQSGNAEAAIVALSLVTGTAEGDYTLIDDELHAPIDQALVVCKHGKNARGGAEFARFVNSEQGRAVMRRYGFVLPGETLVHAP